MAKATIEEWARLYSMAIKLKSLRPWESLSFLDTISIKMPDREEMYYVSIDDNVELISINILRDSYSYGKFIGTFLNPDYTDEEVFNDICSIDIFSMCISSRQSMPKEQYGIIKELGISFRGKMDWVSFLSKRKGYAPSEPDQAEIILLTECIEQICYAIEEYNEGQIDVNFDEGFALCRYFDDNDKRWYTIERKVVFGVQDMIYYKYENEIQLQRLKKTPFSGVSFDIDIIYVKSKIKETGYERDPIVRLLVVSNRLTGEILQTQIILPNDSTTNVTFEVIFSIIERVGKPNNIHFKSDICEEILADFCNKAGINLTKENRLPNIDSFILSITME